jgi:maleylacetate reductase
MTNMTGREKPREFTYDALAGRVLFGLGARRRAAAEVSALGCLRVLVIGDAGASAAAREVAGDLGVKLAGTRIGVEQHVPEQLAAEAREQAGEVGADGLLCVGGGSATGLAKAVAVESGLPILAIPTTYAGSEMTPIYGLTGEHKRTGRDLRALPKVVLYDPELTVGLPANVSAASGFNALAHCVEALYAPGANPVTSLQAEEGVRAMASALPRVVRATGDLAARSDALYGAYLAGAALAVAGTALHHKACHVLGGSFGLVHGDVNAVLLPHVVAYNTRAVPDEMRRVAVALGAGEDGDAAAALFDLAAEIGAPTSLAALGLPAGALAEAAERIVGETGASNPRPVDRESVLRMLEQAYSGARPLP